MTYIEPTLWAEQNVTTHAVLSLLQKQSPDADITFVMGPDNLFNFAKFYKAQDILQRWSVMACPEKVAIRSTDIRQRLAENLDITDLTTISVRKILQQRKLY
ncbi:hypothetical protein [Vibrio anguillarum]|uniref:hypothetical protein n=1 Tax=Vibrio anguillarum TaxID=55601 RepID=UPI003B96C3F1